MLALERRVEDVALDDVDVRPSADEPLRALDAEAQIHGDHVARAPLGGEVRVPPEPAARVEDNLVAEVVRAERLDPVEQLTLRLGMDLDEVLPLPAEGALNLLLGSRELGREQARDAPFDRVAGRAAPAGELAALDVGGAVRLRLESEVAAADRAGDQVEEPSLHALD